MVYCKEEREGNKRQQDDEFKSDDENDIDKRFE